jgi:hypothetical protein
MGKLAFEDHSQQAGHNDAALTGIRKPVGPASSVPAPDHLDCSLLITRTNSAAYPFLRHHTPTTRQ